MQSWVGCILFKGEGVGDEWGLKQRFCYFYYTVFFQFRGVFLMNIEMLSGLRYFKE